MSDAIIVSIVKTMGDLLVAFINRGRRPKKQDIINQKTSEPEHAEEPPTPVQVGPELDLPIEQNLVEKTTMAPKMRCNLTHDQIVKEIEAASPFHQQAIHDNFVGARVTWQTALDGISHLNDRCSVCADIPDGPGTLHCYARKEDVAVFMGATSGSSFFVTGDIETVARYEATLRNCTFELAEEKC